MGHLIVDRILRKICVILKHQINCEVLVKFSVF